MTTSTGLSWSEVYAELRRRADLPSLFERYGVKVTRHGQGDAVALCPFHGDKATPDLHLYPDGHYYCHACAAHGDPVDVVMWGDNCQRADAVRRLAAEHGISIKPPTKEEAEAEDRRAHLASVYQYALTLCQQWLWDEKIGAEARAYLAQRGITEETARFWGLGYWPGFQSSKAFSDDGAEAKDRKPFTRHQLQEAGLVRLSKNPDGPGEYDTLHGCIVEPLYQDGAVVYLAGRHVPTPKDREGQPKTVKLPGVPCPPLMGLQHLRSGKRTDAVVVVEGDIDAMTVRQAGPTTVAMLGAKAHADEAAQRLSRFERVVLMLDADEAGIKATRLLGTLLGSRARVARPSYPEGIKDPNDFVQARLRAGDSIQDATAAVGQVVKAAIDTAPSFLDWMLADIDGEADAGAKGRRVQEDLVPFLAGIDEIERSGMIDRVVQVCGRWLKRPAIERAVRAATKGTDAGTHEQRLETWSSRLCEQLFEGESSLYRGLFYERDGKDPMMVLFGKRRGEEVRVSLSSARQACAALSPELGDTDDWIVRQVPGVDAKAAGTVLLGALRRLAARMDSRTGMNQVTEGLHFIEDIPVLVDRRFTLVKDDSGWQRVDFPILKERHHLEAHRQVPSWLPAEWSLDDLNRPLKYSATEALDLVLNAIKTGWSFRDECDALLHALCLFALPCADLWPRKPLVHVRGPSSSGKSRLIEGLYLGRIAGMPGGLAVTGQFLYDVTSAGLAGHFGGSSMTLVFDEFEGSEQQRDRITELFRALRVAAETSSTQGGGRVRGTQDGGSRSDQLAVPVVAGSIELISSNEADLNRWVVTELVRAFDHEDPKLALLRWKRENKVDIDELKRTLLLWSVGRQTELRERYEAIATDETLSAVAESRFLEGIRALLAVADAMGLDYHRLAQAVAAFKRDDYLEARENSRGNQLLEVILGTPIDFPRNPDFVGNPDPRDVVRIPIGAWLEEHPRAEIILLSYGIKIGVHPELERRCLWVRWATAVQTLLKNHPKFGELTPLNLTKLAKDCAGYVSGSEQKKVAGQNWRTSLFLLES